MRSAPCPDPVSHLKSLSGNCLAAGTGPDGNGRKYGDLDDGREPGGVAESRQELRFGAADMRARCAFPGPAERFATLADASAGRITILGPPRPDLGAPGFRRTVGSA